MKKKFKWLCGFEGQGSVGIVAGCCLWMAFCGNIRASESLKRTPDINEGNRRSAYLINLARVNVGATIRSKPDRTQVVDLIDDDGEQKGDQIRSKSPILLINDDSGIAAILSVEKISFIIALPQTQVVNRFNFYNYTAAGNFSVSLSKDNLDFDSPDWHAVGKKEEFDADGAYESRFAMTEARYVKVDFDITREGNIASFGLFGALRNFGFRGRPDYVEAPRLPTHEIINYSYADLYTARSSVAYVSSVGEGSSLSTANNMIDNNIATSYTFAPDDPHPTMVVDLFSQPQWFAFPTNTKL